MLLIKTKRKYLLYFPVRFQRNRDNMQGILWFQPLHIAINKYTTCRIGYHKVIDTGIFGLKYGPKEALDCLCLYQIAKLVLKGCRTVLVAQTVC